MRSISPKYLEYFNKRLKEEGEEQTNKLLGNLFESKE